MPDVKIECPHCHKSFKLNETLAAPLIEETRRKLEREFEEKDEALESKRKAFVEEQKAAEKARKDIERDKTFGEIEGVWVTTPALAIALAGVLRHALAEASLARRATEGQQDKMAILYQYLTGPQFRQRVEAIKEAFTAMQADLITERTVYERHWAKRQKQIDRVMASTVGMWGELQAIAGTSLQQIEGLELKSLGTAIEEGTQ